MDSKRIKLNSLSDPRLALLRERAADPNYVPAPNDFDGRPTVQKFTDPLNRGLVAASIGAPVDLINVVLNLARAGYGTLGHATGLLSASQMPDLEEKPFGGSEHIGDLMHKYNMVSEHRDPMLEMAAGLLPLAPKGLSMAVNSTRPGRNLVRIVKNTDPLKAAAEELARNPSANERAVKVSKRGWVGPIAEGDATSVSGIRNPGIFEPAELVHTHSMNPDMTMNPLSAGDRGSIPVSALHTEPNNGRLTVYRERLGSGQPPTFDDYVRQEDYVNQLLKDPTYSSNVDPAQYKAGWLDPRDVSAYSGENLGAQVASEVSPVDRLWLDSLRGGEAPAAEAQVIKPKGGNWIKMQEYVGDPIMTRMDKVISEMSQQPDEVSAWGAKQLSRYMHNELGTPEDPLRLLADKGISHIPDTNQAWMNNHNGWLTDNKELAIAREYAGFPAENMAQTPKGIAWENAADKNFIVGKAEQYLGTAKGAHNPWLSKVDPNTTVYDSHYNDFEFPHLIDELRNSINPNSGLPPELLMKYSSLDRLSVPQAVERVHKINEWRAQQAIEANQALANNAATVLHKEYPDVGMKWVQLKNNPEAPLPEGWSSHVDKATGRQFYMDESGKKVMNNPYLAEALKYEGDTMGHCVGGYCDQVADGRTNIFSLRDEKGRPHVTIETRPGVNIKRTVEETTDFDDRDIWYSVYDALPPNRRAKFERYMNEAIFENGDYETAYDAIQAHPQYSKFLPRSEEVPPDIIQIKGKGNAKPADKYLPMVQDFIRSQKWGRIGDFDNTDLRKIGPKYFTDAELQSVSPNVNPDYLDALYGRGNYEPDDLDIFRKLGLLDDN